MDWKQFTSSIVGSVAWPVAMVVIALIFRDQIRRLIMQVRKVAAGGVSVELAETIQDVKEQVKELEADEDQPLPDVITLDPTTLALLARNPEAAVLQEFKELENTLLQIRPYLPGDKPHMRAYDALRHLSDLGHISPSAVALYMSLRHVRHNLASGDSGAISLEDATAMVRDMRRMADILRRAGDKLRAARKSPVRG